MAFRPTLLAAAITVMAAAAIAQTTTPNPPPPHGESTRDGERATRTDDQRATADTDRTESTGDFNVAGDVSSSALIGSKIHNESKDTVGTVEDLFVDDQGTITTVVVSVGGFLGVGARSVGVKWSDIRRRRDGNSIVLLTTLGKDELKALPPYIAQLRKPAPRDQVAGPR